MIAATLEDVIRCSRSRHMGEREYRRACESRVRRARMAARLLGDRDLLPALAGGSPGVARGPDAAFGGSSGTSQFGDRPGFSPTRGPRINVPTGEAVLSPTPNGVDDSAALQEWINACVGGRGVWQSSGAKYLVTKPLRVPATSYIEALNPETCEIERIGNGDTFQLMGSCYIRGLTVRARTPQVEGNVFTTATTGGEPDNIILDMNTIGSNVFCGYEMVAPEALATLGIVRIYRPHFVDIATGSACKNVKTCIELGSPVKRTVGVWIDDFHAQINANNEGTVAMRIRNTDSLHMSKTLIQNAETGILIGENDNSALKTTNSYLADVQCDGCKVGFDLANMQERHQWYGVSAEASGEMGLLVLSTVSGLKIVCHSFSHNGTHGVQINSTSTTASNTLAAGDMNCNGEGGAAGTCGVLALEGTGGWKLVGNDMGNPTGVGGEKQKLGLALGKNCKYPTPRANRIFNNATANLSIDATATPSAATIEAANDMA